MVSLLVICTKFAPLSLTALHNFPSPLDDWVLEAVRQCQALPRSSIPEIYQDVRACYRHMFSLGAMKIEDISWHIPASCSPRDSFPSSFGSQASTAATSRVIFLDVDGVILPAGLNLSRFKIARRVERIEEGVWVLVPS